MKSISLDAPLPATLVEDWEEIFSKYGGTNHGHDLYTHIFDHPTLFPLQRMRETKKMIQNARQIQPEVVMEIGADKGGGFYHWVKCFETVKKAICLEIRGTPYAQLFIQYFPGVEFLFLPDASLDLTALTEIQHFLGPDSIDCLFIDGDKCGFTQDFWAYYSKLKPGSRVYLHDIHGEAPPAEVYRILQTQFRSETIIDLSEGGEAIQREYQGIPIHSAYEGWLRTWNVTSCGVGCIYI